MTCSLGVKFQPVHPPPALLPDWLTGVTVTPLVRRARYPWGVDQKGGHGVNSFILTTYIFRPQIFPYFVNNKDLTPYLSLQESKNVRL